MANVWEASDERLGRLVAVKILYAHLAADPQFLERFRREALAAARLHNPNIVQVFDSGLDGGNYFIVMELLTGGSLRDVMKRQRLSIEEVAAVGVATARALGYAHEHSIVHRDIKPANILLSSDGHLKVADFGIAKAQEHEELTGTRDVIGTAAYLSPEQLRGEEPRPASDIYALGVVLFELLAGRRPFPNDTNIAAAISRLTQAPPPLASLAPDVPKGLAGVVDRCLDRDLATRYSSAGEVIAALEPFAGRRSAIDLRISDGGAQDPLGAAPTPKAPRPNQPATGERTRTVVAPGPPVAAPGGPGTGQGGPPSQGPPRLQGQPRPLPPAPPQLAPKKKRRVLKALLLLLLLALLALGGFIIGNRLLRGAGVASIPGVGTPGAKVIEVKSFDPQGDGTESEQRARFAHDGDSTTAWMTERYSNPTMGGLKSGVGLLFRFDKRATCGGVTVHTTAPGWSGEIRVGDSQSASADGYRVVGRASEAGTAQQIDTGTASGEYWLVWFTLLPPATAGGGYRLDVTDIDFGVCS